MAPADDATMRALASGDFDERRAALETLATRPAALDAPSALAVVGCLATPRKDVQRRATDLLKAARAAARTPVLEALRAACAGADPTHRWGAAYALGQLEQFTPALIPPLLEALGQEDGDQRWAAAEILVTNGRTHAATLTPALLAAVVDCEPRRRKMVLYIVRDLGLDTADACAALLQGMRDPDVGVRLAALSGLARLAQPPQEAGQLVLDMAAGDPEPGARRAAVSLLGAMPVDADRERAVLDAALASDDPALRRAAAAAQRRRRPA